MQPIGCCHLIEILAGSEPKRGELARIRPSFALWCIGSTKFLLEHQKFATNSNVYQIIWVLPKFLYGTMNQTVLYTAPHKLANVATMHEHSPIVVSNHTTKEYAGEPVRWCIFLFSDAHLYTYANAFQYEFCKVFFWHVLMGHIRVCMVCMRASFL